jgi:hypothetical protein
MLTRLITTKIVCLPSSFLLLFLHQQTLLSHHIYSTGFVHAKYRFILKPTGDYTVHFADPDIRFNWPGYLHFFLLFHYNFTH